jgi:integron integrase
VTATALVELAHGPTKTGSPRLDWLWHVARSRGDAAPTSELLAALARRFILFHDKRHPREMGLAQVTLFPEHVAKTEREQLPELAQARAALALLYERVVGTDLGGLSWPRPPRVLDQLRLLLRVRNQSRGTEDRYVWWALRFILFHRMRHPRTMGAAEIEQFLGNLATQGRVSASTPNQAFHALLFFYRDVLQIDLGQVRAVRARCGKRLPVVLAPEEVRRVLGQIVGAECLFSLIARLLYGCGLRVHECCTLRVRDIELARGQIAVRAGKGNKDRAVMLPGSVRPDLERQPAARRAVHEHDLALGVARVELPDALERNFPRAVQAFEWQFVFAPRQLSKCPRTGRVGRHHILDGPLQRAVARAGIAAGLGRAIHCHTFRHRFATNLVERGVNMRS